MLNLFKISVISCFWSFLMRNSVNDLELNLKCIFQNVSKNFFLLETFNLDYLFYNQTSLEIDYIKVQELSFLPEYFLITALFCLTLFFLFSMRSVSMSNTGFAKFQYENQFIFLLIFILVCYLVGVTQQVNVASLFLTSFNDTINNDLLSLTSKWIIGVTSLLYLIFINNYLKSQKLSNFEYYIILFVSIFGFLLLCCVNDFITAYLAIELQGLAFYVLASFKKSSNFSVESGVKYFVLGSLSTALFLLGITMIYGLCGSVFFLDFKDFFAWIFVVNSIFFTFDALSSGFETFQETLGLDANLEQVKLKAMYDKLDLLRENANFSSVEPGIINSEFENIVFASNWSKTPELVTSVVTKFLECYSNISYSLVLDFSTYSKIVDFNFLQATCIISSINDFLIESLFQNSSADLLYALHDCSLNYSDFSHLKVYLLNSNYYEEVDLEKFYGFSNDVSITTNMQGEASLNSVYEFLDYSYYSDHISNNLKLAGFLQDSNSSSLFASELIGEPFFYKNLQNSLIDQCYKFSLVQILNLNNFFLKFVDVNSVNSEFVFDLSFLIIGFVVVILALFFKLALAPFHLWAPDVYEGSPSSSTFFFMVLSKFGIFILLFRLCYFSFYSFVSYWQTYSLIIASVSIVVGAIAGLKQRKLKSLLTYSSINNMGFVLLAFSSGSFEGIQISFYYLIVYMLASLCIWFIVLNLNLKQTLTTEKQNKDLGDLALLQESNGVIAQGLGITLFSLAGLPPLIGFLAKMSVFKVLSSFSIYYISIINILFSVIATFYYLRLVKIVFFENFLVGSLYSTINLKSVFILNFLTFLLVFFFFDPMVLYLYSYKITLFLNGSFF